MPSRRWVLLYIMSIAVLSSLLWPRSSKSIGDGLTRFAPDTWRSRGKDIDICLAQKTPRERTEHHSFNLDAIHAYLNISDPSEFSPTQRVLILTPLMDAAQYLDGYFDRLATLDYPQELLSLGFIVSTKRANSDPTLSTLQTRISTLLSTSSYHRITVMEQTSQATHSHGERHAYELQAERRKTLARCRNTLLGSSLLDESWVLWLDVDVIEYSPTLLIDLMQHDKDVIVPNCFRLDRGWIFDKLEPYDRNNWIETTESLANQRVMDDDEILFEGYNDKPRSFRQSMADLSKDVEPLAVDGVGGTFTLVKAIVHRAGVNFPTRPVDHQIETEGFAKWAKLEGFTVFGVPGIIVQHA